jgi:hypothetical protein
MINYKELKSKLFDSDGNHPDEFQFAAAMDEFRNTDCITGYWFVDVSQDSAADLYIDPWSGKMLQSSDCGPVLDEIDFKDMV